MSSPRKLHVLSLGRYSQNRPYYSADFTDGGGVRGLSSLQILGSIMRSVVHGNPDQGSLDGVYPCDYFDVIAGSGIGG